MPRGDHQREIARLVGLGASVAEEQGNEFCVEP